MIKKKAKKKAGTAGKKSRKSGKKGTSKRKQMDPAKVREEIAGLVKVGAPKIAGAVIGQAQLGDLARAKYLFEMAGIYPKPAEGEQATEEEDCLAKTLLARLDAGKKVETEKGESADVVKTDEGPGSPQD